MNKRYRRRKVSWSELSPDLLSSIAERLEIRGDILHFRRICKTWRASAPLSLLTSKNILTPLFPQSVRIRSEPPDPVLMATSVYLLRSSVNHKLPPFLLSVEEFIPGKLCIRKPLSKYVAENVDEEFPKVLDLSHFRVLELCRFHALSSVDMYSPKSEEKRYPESGKVVIFVDPNCRACPTIDDDCCAVILNYDYSNLTVKFFEKNKRTYWKKVSFKGRRFEDIVEFKGKIYAIDRTGKVCSMDYRSLKMSNVVEDSVCAAIGRDNIKHLIAWCGELYLIYKWWKTQGSMRPAFKVFKLNEKEEKWDYLQGIGDDNILFVCFEGGFFASAKDFPGWKGNCVVFPPRAFSPNSDSTFDDYIFNNDLHCHDVAVYNFIDGDCFLASSYPRYSTVVWPPPSWLWTDTCSSKGEESEKDDASSRKEMSISSLQATGEGFHTNKEFRNQFNVDSVSGSNSLLKNAEKEDVSKVKFQGVDVSSHFVPILQKIWDKHGNVIERHVAQSVSVLTSVLESLANIILIIQSNSKSSINETQAKFLDSAFLELQILQFKLDWLFPFVKKALIAHKKILMTELEKAKPKLQAELREVKTRLAETRITLSDDISRLNAFAWKHKLASASLNPKDVLS